jgi:hypothetical protein
MKLPRFSHLFILFAGVLLLALSTTVAFAQEQEAVPQGASAGNVLGHWSAAFSGVKVVQKVQLSGNATWHVGGLEDTGTVTLTASSDGSSQMQLALATAGQRSETQTGLGSSASCRWAGNDGVSHNVDLSNCWRPALWFLPSFSFQPSLASSNRGDVDLGVGTVGSDAKVYRHLQSQIIPSGLPSTFATSITQQSTTDLGLDPATLLPAVLAYTVHPDNGAQGVTIAIEVRYSDYRTVDGVQIPFLIRRYLNGSLQLEISVSSAQIN